MLGFCSVETSILRVMLTLQALILDETFIIHSMPTTRIRRTSQFG